MQESSRNADCFKYYTTIEKQSRDCFKYYTTIDTNHHTQNEKKKKKNETNPLVTKK